MDAGLVAIGRRANTTNALSISNSHRANYLLRAELLSLFWPNCDCREFGPFSGVLAELLKILVRLVKCEL